MLPSALCWLSGDTICGLGVPLVVPSRRTLRPASPSLQWVPWASVPHLPGQASFARPSVLCSATTAKCPSRVPSLVARPPIPCRRSRKETIGSPKFPSCPRRLMPRSQTPVVSCSLALSLPGLLPSAACTASAFPRFPCEFILLSTTIHISGLNSAACFLVPPSSVLPLPGLHVGFPTGLLARLWPGGT
jgi:hypothetical protein